MPHPGDTQGGSAPGPDPAGTAHALSEIREALQALPQSIGESVREAMREAISGVGAGPKVGDDRSWIQAAQANGSSYYAGALKGLAMTEARHIDPTAARFLGGLGAIWKDFRRMGRSAPSPEHPDLHGGFAHDPGPGPQPEPPRTATYRQSTYQPAPPPVRPMAWGAPRDDWKAFHSGLPANAGVPRIPADRQAGTPGPNPGPGANPSPVNFPNAAGVAGAEAKAGWTAAGQAMAGGMVLHSGFGAGWAAAAPALAGAFGPIAAAMGAGLKVMTLASQVADDVHVRNAQAVGMFSPNYQGVMVASAINDFRLGVDLARGTESSAIGAERAWMRRMVQENKLKIHSYNAMNEVGEFFNDYMGTSLTMLNSQVDGPLGVAGMGWAGLKDSFKKNTGMTLGQSAGITSLDMLLSGVAGWVNPAAGALSFGMTALGMGSIVERVPWLGDMIRSAKAAGKAPLKDPVIDPIAWNQALLAFGNRAPVPINRGRRPGLIQARPPGRRP